MKGCRVCGLSRLAFFPPRRWYLDVVREAELADYGPVRGTMVIRPYGYAVWCACCALRVAHSPLHTDHAHRPPPCATRREHIQSWLDKQFKATGHSNAYFPQLIPYSFIAKEAAHVEGFAPELALVTRGGGKELEEPLVVRPTSETVVNHMFAQWIHSYRDLPLLINQWANVHRWEMRTRPFIRTLEFLWQEGHTAHATAAEAEAEAQAMITLYSRFAYEVAALPVVVGRKSKTESFAGADITYTIEAMMGDGKALQAGTSHNLGQNFAKAFDIQFTDEDGARRHVWQTSWGVSTRMVGGVIMAHGDDTGLRLPPALAPTQLVVVPIWKTEAEKPSVLAAAQGIADAATGAGLRVHIDAREGRTPGWKYNHWEMKGVPLRCEVGPRDVAAGTCVLARRDIPGKAGKTAGVPLEPVQLVATLRTALDEVQASLLAQAVAFRDAHIVDVTSYEQLQQVVDTGCWARGPWSGSVEDEARVKTETGATFRCYPFDQPKAGPLTCFMTGQPATEVAIFAKAY